MQIPPYYAITSDILKLISEIEAKRLYFNSISMPIALIDKIQRVSILKSSLFSARIEGNPLDISAFDSNRSNKEKKREVFNIQKAASYINSLNKKSVTKNMLLKLHKLILSDIIYDGGKFRQENSAIFNQAGIAIYITPPPSEIGNLIDKLLDYINKDEEKFPIITALIAHLVFEKIHPFLDGNGRVGRLLIGLVLKIKGWNTSLTIPFEEYLDENKNEYYYNLDNGMDNTDDYLYFMLNAYINQFEKTRLLIENEIKKKDSIFLPPRQEEILSIIKDHAVVSFDMIKRRFLKVPDRTLRYDIKKLIDKDKIEKTGTTKGVYYRAKPK